MTWLWASTYVVNGEPVETIRDAHHDGGWRHPTGCGDWRHHPAMRSKRQREAVHDVAGCGYDETLTYLDCPCDVACPHCGAAEGGQCYTLDGGGTSGGGWSTNWHAKRVKASPRCQAVLAGTRRPCDWDWHAWRRFGTLDEACCLHCAARAPLHDGAGSHAAHLAWAAEQREQARGAAENAAGVVRLGERR